MVWAWASTAALSVAMVTAYPPPARASWTIVRTDDGDIAFSMPVKPTPEMVNADRRVGSLAVLTYSCIVDEVRYQLQRMEASRPIAPGRVIAELARLKQGNFKEHARLVKETKVVVDGVVGDDFTYEVPLARGVGAVLRRIRHLMTGRFYYVLSVESAPGKPLPAAAGRFVNSLTFEAIVKADHARANSGASPTTKPQRGGGGTRAADQPRQIPPGPATKVKLADGTPEDALKTFLLAMGAHDADTLRSVTLPEPDFEWLLKGPLASLELLTRLKAQLEEKPMKRLKAGDPVRMPGRESRVIRPDDVRAGRVVLWPEGVPLPSRLENVNGHWKVFARPFITARKAAHEISNPAHSTSAGSKRGAGR